MKFCIRVDDLGFLPTDPKKSDDGLALAQRFHEAMQELPYLGAVIPSTVNQVGVNWLRSNPEGLTLALHGWNHEKSDGVESEFRNLSGDECRKRICAGRLWLLGNQGVIPHFVPPWNALEPNLIEACYHEGIKYIWGEPSNWPTPPQPYAMGRITFVPSWKPLYAATAWRMSTDTPPLSETLLTLLDQPGKAIITLHITWEAAKCNDFRGMRWLVEKIKDRVISPEEYLAV